MDRLKDAFDFEFGACRPATAAHGDAHAGDDGDRCSEQQEWGGGDGAGNERGGPGSRQRCASAGGDASITSPVDGDPHDRRAVAGIDRHRRDVLELTERRRPGRSTCRSHDSVHGTGPLAPLGSVRPHPIAPKVVPVDEPFVEAFQDDMRRTADLVVDEDDTATDDAVAATAAWRLAELLDGDGSAHSREG